MSKYLGFVLVGAMVAFGPGCSDDGGTGGTGGTGGGTGGTAGDGGNGGGGEVDLCAENGGSGEITFPEEITQDTFLSADCEYLLSQGVGSTFVTSGATVRIEEGVTVFGEQEAACIVTKSGRVEAEGSATNPIVFTSAAPEGSRMPADWGGIVLLGLAKINRVNPDGCDGTNGECTDTIEGLDPREGRGTFGGNDDAHDCGTLRYVRIEFAGFTFGLDNELNTLTLGGCGTGTTLEYIQAHRGEDDGLEFFGGTADAQYVVVSGTGDDGLDTDQGYSGTISNAIVHHFAPRSGDPRGIESDNWSTNNNVAPRTGATFENVTLIGDAQTDQGVVLRRGSFGVIDGGVIVDFAASGVDYRDAAWDQAGADAGLTLTNTCMNGNSPDLPTDVNCVSDGEGGSEGDEDCNDWDMLGDVTDEASFFAEDTELAPGVTVVDPGLGDVSGAANGGTPDYSVSNASCAGAFAPDGTDWTTGWTAYPAN